VFDCGEIKETHVVQDQLMESINAALKLRNDGRTVRGRSEHPEPVAAKTSMVDGHPEVVAATVAATVAMVNS
jgi:hypothetical protein